jgi:LPXTG-motif cell wall-anchored protein
MKHYYGKKLLGISAAVAITTVGAFANAVVASEDDSDMEYISYDDVANDDVVNDDVANDDDTNDDVANDDVINEDASVDDVVQDTEDVEQDGTDDTGVEDDTAIEDDIEDGDDAELINEEESESEAEEDLLAVFENGVTTCEIKLKDNNDTIDSNAYTDWQDSADYDVDDVVPYKMTATIAEDYEAYSKYKLSFHVIESEVFQFDTSSVRIYLNEINSSNLISSDKYEVITEATKLDDGAKFNIRFDDLKSIEGIEGGSNIIVTYNSILGDSDIYLYPVIGYNISGGTYGNPTSLYVEYSNNPYDENSVAKTDKDMVTVLSYGVVISKLDESKQPLAGAVFTLYKKIDGTFVKVNRAHNVEPLDFWTRNDTKFVWYGLDDGEYKIVETTAPEGYDACDDIVFTITASHDAYSDDPQLTSLVESSKKFVIKDNFDRVITGDGGSDVTNHYDEYDGYLITDVVNYETVEPDDDTTPDDAEVNPGDTDTNPGDDNTTDAGSQGSSSSTGSTSSQETATTTTQSTGKTASKTNNKSSNAAASTVTVIEPDVALADSVGVDDDYVEIDDEPVAAAYKLPQTGQSWWPIPMLMAFGSLLVTAGVVRRKKVDIEE